jgi:outer membrane immunogenic protein
MNKLWFAVAALALMGVSAAKAADVAVKARTPMVAATWSGYYVGANAGLGAGKWNNDWNFFSTSAAAPGVACGTPAAPGPALCITGSDSTRLTGAIGGLQAGINWQFANWLIGIESDFQFSNQRGEQTFTTNFVPPLVGLGVGLGTFSATYSEKLQWLSTQRARLGFVTDRGLFYATGGIAFGRVRMDGTSTVTGSTAGVCGGLIITPCPFATWSSSTLTQVGWAIGGGIETSLGNNWSFKGEYLHVDLGSVTTSFATPAVCAGGIACVPSNPGTGTINTKITAEIVRLGINYKFAGLLLVR